MLRIIKSTYTVAGCSHALFWLRNRPVLSRISGVTGPTDPCKLAVTATNDTTKEACQASIEVLDNEIIDSTAPRHIVATWKPSESRDMYFAIHVYDGPSWFRVNVRNLTIKDLGNISAPAAVEDLAVVPEGNGSLKATVSFTVPSLTMGGTQLERISRMEISRNGEFVRAFSNVKPGEKVEYVDEVDVPDFYDYSVAGISGDSDKGPEASTRLYVGSYDCPATFLGENAQSDSRYMKVVDSNADNNSWTWDNNEAYSNIFTMRVTLVIICSPRWLR